MLYDTCFYFLLITINHLKLLHCLSSLTDCNTFSLQLTEAEDISRRVMRVLHFEAVRVMMLVVRWDILTTCASKSTGMEILCLRAVESERCETMKQVL